MLSNEATRGGVGDAPIAQCCVDDGALLITRDKDFRAFADAAGLEPQDRIS